MSTQAFAAQAHEEQARDPLRRLRINRLGLWLFFLSDGLLFGIMATVRFAIADTHVDESISQILGLGITGILLLSSLTAYRGEVAFTHGNIRQGQLMFLATLILGMIFFGGVVLEWSIAEFSVTDPYGTAFFAMTGMHATHVATGLLFLMMGLIVSRRGKFDGGGKWAPQAIVMYWHFVDVVWVFFYPILYLLQ